MQQIRREKNFGKRLESVKMYTIPAIMRGVYKICCLYYPIEFNLLGFQDEFMKNETT